MKTTRRISRQSAVIKETGTFEFCLTMVQLFSWNLTRNRSPYRLKNQADALQMLSASRYPSSFQNGFNPDVRWAILLFLKTTRTCDTPPIKKNKEEKQKMTTCFVKRFVLYPEDIFGNFNGWGSFPPIPDEFWNTNFKAFFLWGFVFCSQLEVANDRRRVFPTVSQKACLLPATTCPPMGKSCVCVSGISFMCSCPQMDTLRYVTGR